MLRDETDVAEAVRAAKDPLRLQGGGTRGFGARVQGDVLSVAGLSGITLYEPGALTLVAQAGTPVAEIETALAAENQRLAFEPMDHRTVLGIGGVPTIGGVVAANVSGPRRIAVGACRDFMLGVRYVNGSGEVVKNGGRVMKNVTGYDLVKLMSGSYGTLGVLTEVSLKVLPAVETAATLRFNDLDIAQSVACMSAALGSPFEVTGAARVGTYTCLRIEGFAGSVAYRTAALQRTLASFGTAEVITDAPQHATLWSDIRDLRSLAAHPSIWRVSLRPSAMPGFVAAIDHDIDVTLDWGGGLAWIAMNDGNADALHADLQQAAAVLGGHATVIKGTTGPTFQPEAPALAQISAGLRAKFDPRGIFNTGMMT